jgi:hypothetical protein
MKRTPGRSSAEASTGSSMCQRVSSDSDSPEIFAEDPGISADVSGNEPPLTTRKKCSGRWSTGDSTVAYWRFKLQQQHLDLTCAATRASMLLIFILMVDGARIRA